MLDVRRLQVLSEIDRCGSFSAAALALGMSQPAVSQHIAALEQAVDVPLVERGTRPVGLTAAGHALVRRRPLTLRDLAGETWIGGTPTSTWFHIVRRACRAVGVEPHVRFTTDDYVAIQALVAADLGVAVLPSLAVGPAAHRVHACALAHPTPTRRIAVALPPDGHRHAAVQIMIDILRRAGRRRGIDGASSPDFDR